ncbi:MAG: VOC family protein [Actinobacteria bacterium]|nr:VOC family protein [Actinomycetota bacterium]
MTSRPRNITFDCRDARTLSWFWAQALGWNRYYDDDPEVFVAPSYPPRRDYGPGLLFIPVPEGKSAKNRVHLDVTPDGCTREEEVERLIGLGATVLDDRRTADGAGWVVMADPEGNEFCVERSEQQRATPAARSFRLSYDDPA